MNKLVLLSRIVKLAAIVVMWLVTTVFIVGVMGGACQEDARNADILPIHGKQIQAKVTFKKPGDLMNQQQIEYDYIIGDDWLSSGSPVTDPTFDKIHVGDTITVYYLPNARATSGFDWAGMRASTRRSDFVVAFVELFATAFCGGFMVLALYLFKNTNAY